MNAEKLKVLVQQLYSTVSDLEEMFPGRPFTPDGHMVGSLGECLVAHAYGLKLLPPSCEGYDAVSADGRKIEIKATQGKSVAFRSCPEHAIKVKIRPDGSFEECYNGPGGIIWREFQGKKKPSNGQYQISITKVKKLATNLPDDVKIYRLS
ncbi:MAG: DUF6998 domain-containing protein [Syntrophorhabdaceae bacterium]